MRKWSLCFAASVLLGQAAMAAEPFCQDRGDNLRVTILGSGTPFPTIERFGPSTLIEAGGQKLVVDAGRGVTQRLWQLGIPIGSIDAVLLTHLHSDHTVGLPDVMLMGWLPPAFGRRTVPLALYGPEMSSELARGIEAAWARDIEIRAEDEDLDPAAAKFQVTEIEPGLVYDKDGLRITAFPVDHGALITPSYGYRIEYKDHVAVISGDTRYDERVAQQAAGAGLLLHAVIGFKPSTIAAHPQLQRIVDHMASTSDVNRIARAAKAELTVLTHITQMPPDPPSLDEMLAEIRQDYSGRVEMGKDLFCIDIGEEVNSGMRE